MVPDFLLPRGASGASGCEELAELKVLSCCPSHYSPTAGTKAVDVRAQAVPGEYARKARAADQRYLGVLPGEVGPVEKKLQEFPLSVYVFGAFGEASEDVHALVKTVAEARVKSSGLGLGKGGRELKWEGAVGVATGLVRRRLFTVAVREQARLLLDRVPFSGASGLAPRGAPAAGGGSAGGGLRLPAGVAGGPRGGPARLPRLPQGGRRGRRLSGGGWAWCGLAAGD